MNLSKDREKRHQIHEVVDACFHRLEAGESFSDDAVVDAHPELMPELGEELRRLRVAHEAPTRPEDEPTQVKCPNCNKPVGFPAGQAEAETCSFCGSRRHVDAEAVLKAETRAVTQIGRYRIERLLGAGGFGRVYLARDDELQRSVAIKVPHSERVETDRDAQQYLAEARIVAGLDHPAIVPVHDVGRTDDGLCYVVSKFIEGSDLSERMKRSRPSHNESAEIVATVAEALHHAHIRGIFHRDIKPSNILLDANGRPYVTDFGLAVKEEDLDRAARHAGTPAYMSPEQARGEGHRLDGRSDIFSLGIVLYELITGRRPFRGSTVFELISRITATEPRPPRQIDDRVAKELERICLKALAKRVSERYTTASDLAEDLRYFLATTEQPQPTSSGHQSAPSIRQTPVSWTTGASGLGAKVASFSADQFVRVVPKGLRSFDAEDADFFLDLLPGPRDRTGLPDSIRLLKNCIDFIDPDKTFAVGLIYGPSGCGKSSLVKAGLLPRLADHLVSVYVEATPEDTTTRLMKELKKHCPYLPAGCGLRDAVAALRRGRDTAPGSKVLIVLDQFEQWLHANREQSASELVEALRHCDGGRVQCVVIVRDDFWMAATEFFQTLEIRLVEAESSFPVHLFDRGHSKKVLTAFGRAFGVLPESREDFTRSQKAFLEQAVSGLAREEKVVCVRLALFAEMMKGKPWTPATLKAMGGADGVGVRFLEETFSATTAAPEHRLHANAAAAVLKKLLPEHGVNIRGNQRTHRELLEASGYRNSPRQFDQLLQILVSELRLVAPTEPERKSSGAEPEPDVPAECKYYQLTHDYLVPSLREWLTRKQKETRRGRAELRLAERSAVWNAKPENRHLPSLWEWADIRLFTGKGSWTESQRRMMRRSGRVHAMRWGIVLLVVLGVAAYDARQKHLRQAERALAQSQSLVTAVPASLPLLIQGLHPYRRDVLPRLRQFNQRSDLSDGQHARIQLALWHLSERERTPQMLDRLQKHLTRAEAAEFLVFREFLEPFSDELRGKLWDIALDEQQDQERRLRAACALSLYEPDADQWPELSGDVVSILLRQNSLAMPTWIEALQPVRDWLQPSLTKAFDSPSEDDRPVLAAIVLGELYRDHPELGVELALRARPRQLAVLLQSLQRNAEKVEPLLAASLSATNAKFPTEAATDRIVRRSNAAVALLYVARCDSVWPMLKAGLDNTIRSTIVEQCATAGVRPQVLLGQLDGDRDAGVLAAVVLSLGQYGKDQILESQRRSILPRLLELHATHPHPAVHSAVKWLLDRWGFAADATQGDRRSASTGPRPGFDWYVNGQSQVFAVVRGPTTFDMGAPQDEPGWSPDQRRHRRRIPRSFAISTTEVTVEQFLRFDPEHAYSEEYAPDPRCPVLDVNWFDAVRYCRWLSEKEGVPEAQMCYPPLNNIGLRMELPEDILDRTGYRLPTAGEWEYATRAGASTSLHCGTSEELLGRYAWFRANSNDRSSPVARLKPNDFGLFDTYGNALEWCHSWYFGDYPPGDEEGFVLDRTDPRPGAVRELRGGGYLRSLDSLRTAYRESEVPSWRSYEFGFRLARTVHVGED